MGLDDGIGLQVTGEKKGYSQLLLGWIDEVKLTKRSLMAFA